MRHLKAVVKEFATRYDEDGSMNAMVYKQLLTLSR